MAMSDWKGWGLLESKEGCTVTCSNVELTTGVCRRGEEYLSQGAVLTE